MSRRPPISLWVYITWHMWRLILLTAAVLVTVISFSAAVKYLAEGRLGPADCLWFMLLAIPPMLQYALPFAACFGATLTYHRLAGDNEVSAAHAGGVSHRSILVPCIGTGLLLAFVLLVLSNYTIPRFLGWMEELVTVNASKLIVNTIERGDALEMGDTLLYADVVRQYGPDKAAGAFERLQLFGVLVVQLDKDGRVEAQGSARQAMVWLRRSNSPSGGGGGDDGSVTTVQIKPIDVVARTATGLAEGASMLPQFITIPNASSDDPKFLSFGELRGLRDEPERMNFIDKRRRAVALTMAKRQTLDEIRATLRQTGAVEFTDLLDRRYILRAADARPAVRPGDPPDTLRLLPAQKGDPIIFDLVQAGAARESAAATPPTQRFQANAAWLHVAELQAESGMGGVATLDTDPGQAQRENPGVGVTLRLEEVSAQVAADVDGPVPQPGAPSGAMKQWKWADLIPQSDSARLLIAMPTRELMDTASKRLASRPEEQPTLGAALGDLSARLARLMREVVSKEHERVASAAACLVMVLLGGVMAMRLHASLPLTIYLWAFFPALGAVLTISAGQQTVHQHGLAGFLVLWGGVGALAAFTWVQFARLARH